MVIMFFPLCFVEGLLETTSLPPKVEGKVWVYSSRPTCGITLGMFLLMITLSSKPHGCIGDVLEETLR